MDPVRAKPIARNGSGLRPSPVVQGPSVVVDGMAARTPGVCSYGLGAACPLVEIVSRRLMARNEILRWSRIFIAVLGIAVSASALLIVYY